MKAQKIAVVFVWLRTPLAGSAYTSDTGSGDTNCCWQRKLTIRMKADHAALICRPRIIAKGVSMVCKNDNFIVVLYAVDSKNASSTAPLLTRGDSRFIERSIFILIIFVVVILPFLHKKMKRNIYLLRIWWLRRELERFRVFGLYR